MSMFETFLPNHANSGTSSKIDDSFIFTEIADADVCGNIIYCIRLVFRQKKLNYFSIIRITGPQLLDKNVL